jgi:hypothetical protein
MSARHNHSTNRHKFQTPPSQRQRTTPPNPNPDPW